MRDFEAARLLIEDEDLDALAERDAASAVSLLTESALIHREYAEWASAAQDLGRAAERSDNPWLLADWFVNRAQAAAAGIDRCEARSYERVEAGEEPTAADAEAQSCVTAHRAEHASVRNELNEALKGTRRERRAALLWARGSITAGNGPDDRAGFERRLAAGVDLRMAEALAPRAPQPLIAQLRLARNALRAKDDLLEQTVDNARKLLRHVKERAPHVVARHWSFACAVAYEEGRIELARRRWSHARSCLVDALREDPGHQSANVWLVYCDRILAKPPEELIRLVDELLGERSPEAELAAGPAQAVRRVYEPALVAELLTERASLLELARVDEAEADYRRAIAIRPAMWYARRGLMRCLTLKGDTPGAEEQGRRALRLAEDLASDGKPPPDLLVEMGRVKVAAGEYDDAVGLFAEAEELSSGYLYTYRARIAMLRGLERPADAIAEGVRALKQPEVTLMREGGIHVEVGHAHMARLDYPHAMQSFRRALDEDEAGEVQQRAHIGVATVHRLTRRLRDARAELKHAASAPGAWHATGWLEADVGNYGSALRCLERARELRPLDPVVMASYARAMRLIGRPSAALVFLEKRLAEVPERRRPRILNEAGWTQLELRSHEAAAESFKRALEIEPRMGPALRGLMIAEWLCDRRIEVLERGIDRATRAVTMPAPLDVIAGIRNEAGLCCLREGDLPSANRYFGTSLELTGPTRPELRELLLIMQATGLLEAGATADAHARIREAEANAPDLRDHPRIALLRAHWRHTTGDLAGALAAFNDVHAAWPRSGHAMMGIASVYFARRDYPRAEKYLRDVSAAAPQNVDALELLAWTLVRRHEDENLPGADDSWRLRRAASLCDDALALETHRPGVYECLGVIALLRSQLAAAETYMAAAVSCDPCRAEAHRNKAAVHLRMARYDEAIECLQSALRCRGQHQVTHLLLGHALSEAGSDAEAVSHLRQAIRLAPTEPLAYNLLASLLERQSEHDQAHDLMTEALAVVPRRNSARTHLGRCRVLCAQAEGKVKQEENALLDQALRDADEGLRVAQALQGQRRERAEVIAEAHYHRGVVLHRRGLERFALGAFKEALKLDPTHPGAATAANLLRGARRQGDVGERRARRWGNVLAVLALVSAIGAVLMELAMGGWKASNFDFFPLAYVVAGAVVVAIVGVALPRLAALNIGGQVEIRISAPRDIEPIAVTLRFERLDTLPSTMMAGPGALPAPDLPYDSEGEPDAG